VVLADGGFRGTGVLVPHRRRAGPHRLTHDGHPTGHFSELRDALRVGVPVCNTAWNE
jgi:hypothetical protein